MRVFICALFLGAVACYSPSSKTSYLSQQSIEDAKNPDNNEEPILLRVRNNSVPSATSELPKTEPPSTSINSNEPISSFVPTTSAATSINSAKPEIAEIKPIKEEPTPSITTTATVSTEESFSEPPEPQYPSSAEEPSKRRIVTYDQRQEGQYNIRADLDNFMIVLIPPSPVEGLNLLDILTKSSIRPSKNKRKQYAFAGGHRGNDFKYRQNLKSGNTNFNLNYLPRAHSQAHQPPVTLVEGANAQRLSSEFIEGRTPYHVDISASDDEQSRLHPDGPVDVLPPPYPLAYQHLIKPFHLDAEPTVIQALPPSVDINQAPPQASGNFLDTYNKLLASSLNANAAVNDEIENNPGYYRMSRTIRNDNYLDSNRLVSNSLATTGRRVQIPLYRADMSYGASNLYPPLDVPRLMGYLTANSELNSFETRKKALADDYDSEKRPQQLEDARLDEILILPTQDDLELGVQRNGVELFDAESRTLLSDVKTGMERCGPGRRRDSYGMCRAIEGY